MSGSQTMEEERERLEALDPTQQKALALEALRQNLSDRSRTNHADLRTHAASRVSARLCEVRCARATSCDAPRRLEGTQTRLKYARTSA